VLIRSLAVIPIAALLGAAPYLLQQTQPAQPVPQTQPAQQTGSQEAVEFGVPAKIAAETNPEQPTPVAMATSKKMYGYDCAMCHGDNGDGKGNMASSLKTPVKNWQDPASLKGLTDGDLFYMIKTGHGEMPPEGGRQNDDGIWNMVTIVRSFAKK
jgi:mono/diheme cytochrome c family protein